MYFKGVMRETEKKSDLDMDDGSDLLPMKSQHSE